MADDARNLYAAVLAKVQGARLTIALREPRHTHAPLHALRNGPRCPRPSAVGAGTLGRDRLSRAGLVPTEGKDVAL